jgi:predicted esterase
MKVTALSFFLLIFLATLAGCTGSEDDLVESETSTGEFKILALHGGGDSPEGLMGQPGMQDLMSDLPELEFFFADAPDDDSMCDQCWYADPPGGKGEPNEDRNWADISIEYLDGIVEEHGPFYGILGYSQGCPMATVYIANSNTSFEKAFLFNGYLPTTHSGLNDTINEVAPLSVDTLIFGGENDVFIFGVDELAGVYSEPTIIISSTADHHLPSSDDETYGDVLAFFRQGTNGTL